MVEIRVLGPVEIEVGGVVHRPGRRQERYLLGLLALERERFVPFERLVDLLWNESPPAAAKPAVHAMVSRLRAALTGTDATITTRGTAYALEGKPDSIDVWRFWTLIETAAGTPELPSRVRILREALALWRGPALADACDDDRVTRPLEQQRLTTSEDLFQARLELGEATAVVDESAALVAEHPQRERLVRLRMLALHRVGRTAEALAAYSELAGHLREELGLEPGLPTQELHLAILRDDPALLAVESTDAAPAMVVPAQLPAVPGHFVGREDELSRLDALLANDAPHLVVISAISGTPGVGKTALGVQWAHRSRHHFPGGQLYLDLRGFSTDEPVGTSDALTLFLRALGLEPHEIPAELEAAIGRFRSEVAGRRLLVFLDNALNVEQVRPLLPGGADCRVIITSRDTLSGLVAREGAQRLALDALPAAQALDLLTAILGPARVAAEPGAAVELAIACGHLPLALRIAAANLDSQPDRLLADYLAELSTAPLSSLVVAGDSTAAVRAAFDLSYRRLPAPTQWLFELLGAAPGPHLSLAAVRALWDDPQWPVEGLLGQLVQANLVYEPEAERFALHDLIREYAGNVYSGQSTMELTAARARLFDWYLDQLDAVATLLYPNMCRLPVEVGPGSARNQHEPGPEGEAWALSWTARELPALVAAVASADETGPRPYAWRLADALRGYYWSTRESLGWVSNAGHAIAAGRAAGDPLGEAVGEMNLANREWATGDPLSAIGHLERAVPFIGQAGWRQGEASVLGNIGALLVDAGQLERAVTVLTTALAIDRELGWSEGEAQRLSNLGIVHEGLGRISEAVSYYDQALTLYRSIGSRSGEAAALGNIGMLLRITGDLDRAEAVTLEGIAVDRSLGRRHSEAYAINNLGDIFTVQGRLVEGREMLERALSAASEMQDRRLVLVVLANLGLIDMLENDPAAAIEKFTRSVELADEVGVQFNRTLSRCYLAVAQATLGDPDLAAATAETAAELMAQAGTDLLQGEVWYSRAVAKAGRHEYSKAAELARQALAAFERSGPHDGIGRTKALLASLPA